MPAEFAHPLPDDFPLTSGALIEPLAVALHAVRRGNVTAGDRVLITGAGPIGLLVLQAARAVGAGETVVTDVNPGRLRPTPAAWAPTAPWTPPVNPSPRIRCSTSHSTAPASNPP